MKEWVTKKIERRPKSPRVQSSMLYSLDKQIMSKLKETTTQNGGPSRSNSVSHDVR